MSIIFIKKINYMPSYLIKILIEHWYQQLLNFNCLKNYEKNIETFEGKKIFKKIYKKN